MPGGCVRVVDTASPWPKPPAPAKDRRWIAISFAMRGNGLTRQADCDPLFDAFTTGPRTPSKQHETHLSWTNRRVISGCGLDLNFHPSWHDDSNDTIVTSNDAGRTLRRPLLRSHGAAPLFSTRDAIPPRRGGRPARCPRLPRPRPRKSGMGPVHPSIDSGPAGPITLPLQPVTHPRWPRRPTGTSPNERWRSGLPAL
jgi:hypothetical protein